jgi:hypothetical protein
MGVGGPILRFMWTQRILRIVVPGLVLCAPSIARAQAQAQGQAKADNGWVEGQTVTTVETIRSEPSAPLPKEAPAIPTFDQRTAYMVGRHTLKLGILAFDYGLTQHLSIGSDPPSWALRAFIHVWVPNLHTKFQLVDRDAVAVALQAAAYYANTDSENISGHLIDVPLTVFVSVRVHPRITLHAEGAYTYAHLFGTGNITNLQFDGATTSRTGQVGLMAQFRLTRIFSLTATGRYQVYSADLPLSGTSSIDPFTTATLNGQLVPAAEHPWEAIGGVAVLWRHFQMILGAGYGHYFAPGLNIASAKRMFVPDASLAVVL